MSPFFGKTSPVEEAQKAVTSYGLRELGDRYLAQGRFSEATEQFKLVTARRHCDIYPILLHYERNILSDLDNIDLRLSLVDFLLAQEDLPAAVEELKEILELSPDEPRACRILSTIYLKKNCLDEVIGLLEGAPLSRRRNPALTEMLATACLKKGDRPGARRYFEETLESNPKNIKVLKILAQLYVEAGDHLPAAEIYGQISEDNLGSAIEIGQKLKEIVELLPAEPRPRLLLADTYLKNLQPDLAVEEYKRCLELDSDLNRLITAKLRSFLEIYPQFVPALLVLALAHLRVSDFSQAAEIYGQILGLGQQHLAEAVAGLEYLLTLFPDHILGRRYLGQAYLAAGRVDAAIGQWRQLIGLDPREASFVLNACRPLLKDFSQLAVLQLALGEAYLLANELDLAAQQAARVLALDPEDPQACFLSGQIKEKTGQVAAAQADYQKALLLDPLKNSYHEKFKRLSALKLGQQAAEIRRALETDPWRTRLHLELGQLYWQSGQIEEALEELPKALKDGQTSGEVYFWLGRCFKELGQFDLALDEFQKSLEHLAEKNSHKANQVRLQIAQVYEAAGKIQEALATYRSLFALDASYLGWQKKVASFDSASLLEAAGRPLVAVASGLGQKDFIGVWTRPPRPARIHPADFAISFSFPHNNLGFEHFQAGRWLAAEEEFLLAGQFDPFPLISKNNLALVYLKKGDPARAEEYLRQVLALEEKFLPARQNLGMIHQSQGNYLKALELYEVAAQDPGNVLVQINMGDCWYQLKELGKAINSWEKALNEGILPELAQRRLSYKTNVF